MTENEIQSELKELTWKKIEGKLQKECRACLTEEEHIDHFDGILDLENCKHCIKIFTNHIGKNMKGSLEKLEKLLFSENK